ncbi:MAG: putative molybdenum carrier protein [Pirellulaceae bacterium]
MKDKPVRKNEKQQGIVRHGVAMIISGGQTGVDRGALDAAIALGIAHGGCCPRGRLAEDGPIAARYQLQELESADYTVRTQQNVIDSDGTLILYRERLQGGTALTNRLAKAHAKPLLRVRLDRPISYECIVRWLRDNQIRTLNIAGPRRSSHPQIEVQTCEVITKLFSTKLDLPELY